MFWNKKDLEDKKKRDDDDRKKREGAARAKVEARKRALVKKKERDRRNKEYYEESLKALEDIEGKDPEKEGENGKNGAKEFKGLNRGGFGMSGTGPPIKSVTPGQATGPNFGPKGFSRDDPIKKKDPSGSGNGGIGGLGGGGVNPIRRPI